MEKSDQIPSSPSQRAPNIHDVAAALGMHKSTVSQGLSGKGNLSKQTRERIQTVARDMGYQPNLLAQRLAFGDSNNQVCLCAGQLDMGLTAEKILLVQKELARHGLETMICLLSTDGRSLESTQVNSIQKVRRQKPRAIICCAQTLHQSVWPELKAYQSEGGIVVSYDMETAINCDQIVFDREDNAYRVARHLIEAGHTDLGLALSMPPRDSGKVFSPQNARLQGFKRALKEANLVYRDEWIFEVEDYEIGGAGLAADFLALKNRPTGMCIVNDYMALGFMSAVLRAGLQIPRDVSIVGHDNQPVAAFCPIPLTSATHPASEISAAVVETLVLRMSGSPKPPCRITISSEIIERESVAALLR